MSAKAEYHLFPPFLNEIERGTAKRCSLCSGEYGFLNSEHICKRCCRSVCEECVGCLEHPIIKANYSESLHKICRSCKNEHDILDKYAELYKLHFFTNSMFVAQWMKNFSLRNLKEKKVFMGHINEEVIATELWQALNYSLREFVVRVCGECEKDKLEEVFHRVAQITLRLRNLLSTEIEKLAYLVLILAVHCEEQVIMQATVEVLEMVLSEVKEEGVMRYVEMYRLKSAKGSTNASGISESVENEEVQAAESEKLQPLNLEVREKIRDYLESRFAKLTNNLGINSLSAELAVYILNLTLTKRSPREFEKALASLLISHQQKIACGGGKVDEIDRCILRDSNSKIVTDIYKTLTELEAPLEPSRKGSSESEKSDRVKKRPTVQLAADASGMVIRLREENKRLIERQQAHLKEIELLKSKLAGKGQNSSDHEDEASEDLEEEDNERGTDAVDSEATKPTVLPGKSASRRSHRRKQAPNPNGVALLQEVVLSKNIRIDELQSRCDHLEYGLQECQKRVKQLEEELQTASQSHEPQMAVLDSKNEQLEQLHSELDKLRNEKKNMVHMNELLLRKFNELSRQLVDKEERDIGKLNSVADQEIDEMLRHEDVRERLDRNECTTF